MSKHLASKDKKSPDKRTYAVALVFLGVLLAGVFMWTQNRVVVEAGGRKVAVVSTEKGREKLVARVALVQKKPAQVVLAWNEQVGVLDVGAYISSVDSEALESALQDAGWMTTVSLEDYVYLDEEGLSRQVAQIGDDWGLVRVEQAKVSIVDGHVFGVPPRAGQELDESDVVRRALSAFLAGPEGASRVRISVSPRTRQPDVSADMYTKTLRTLENLLRDDILVHVDTAPDVSLVLTPKMLAPLVSVHQEKRGFVIELDSAGLVALIPELARDGAVDARFERDGEHGLRIVPSRPGISFNKEDVLRDLVRNTGEQDTREVTLQTTVGQEPEFSTQDAEALGIKHLLASFTTYHSCCEGRVQNIQNMADIVSETIVFPGEEFNLNDEVGKRTEGRGFVPAGTILKGIFVDTVGGGVSQFATTIYNAAFWSGLEIVEHHPHSRLFSRYPEGVEATVSWPTPDLRFRNDYTTPILILTWYTDTSISVGVYGDNAGRIVAGDHASGATNIDIIEEGGADARQVSMTRSDRYAIRDYIVEYRESAHNGSILEKGSKGWKVKIGRSVINGHGEIIHDDTWVTTYHPVRRIMGISNCDVLSAWGIACQTRAQVRAEKEYLREIFE